MKQIQPTDILQKIYTYLPFDCEILAHKMFANHPMKQHLAYKLTRYCNKYNDKSREDKLNFNGLIDFMFSLDSENIDQFNRFFGN